MSIYIPPTNQKPSEESQDHGNSSKAPAASTASAATGSEFPPPRGRGKLVLGLLLVIVCLASAGAGYALWDSGVFRSQPSLEGHEFSEIFRTISNAAELRATVTRKLELDRAYLQEAQERNEEQMALTFQMSVKQSIEDYRNAGSNWASALVTLHPFYLRQPEQVQAYFATAKAELSATQKTAKEAIDTSLRLLESVPANGSAQDYFSAQLIAEPQI